MNEEKKSDGRPLFRILAAIVAMTCLALLLWSAFADKDMLSPAAFIFIFIGIPMFRLAITGYFWHKT